MACEREVDAWGSSLASLFEGMGALRAGESRQPRLEGAAGEFERLGAGALAAWCLSVNALTVTRLGRPDGAAAAEAAEAASGASANRGAMAYACLALSEAKVPQSRAHALRAAELFEVLGLAPPRPSLQTPGGQLLTSVEINCFGGFRLVVDGRAVDLSSIKPRARALLRLLALNSERAVHREVLTDALWPEAGVEIAKRSLHVAVSSLRNALSREIRGPAIVREGDAYRLNVAAGVKVDVVEFDKALKSARRLRAKGAKEQAVEALGKALDLHKGDLLPEDGPMELVAIERDRCRTEAVNAAAMLAEILLDSDCATEAVRACERGLQIERYRDELWRKLLDAHSQAGDRAAQAVAKRRYARVLEELATAESVG
jgi:DNA-binding SARP family transcriptional activator